MKAITICSVSSCDAATRVGLSQTLLQYNGKTMYTHQRLEDTTANRCIIEGLIVGVKQLKDPCLVKLITSTKIGFEISMPFSVLFIARHNTTRVCTRLRVLRCRAISPRDHLCRRQRACRHPFGFPCQTEPEALAGKNLRNFDQNTCSIPRMARARAIRVF